MRRRGTALGGGVAIMLTTLLLAGCTSGDDGGTLDPSGEPGAAKTAPEQGGVLAEQTVDAPNNSGKTPHGGTLTVTVRSVTVMEGVTRLAWAVRWDNPDAASDASFDARDFFNTWGPPTLVDGAALKLYYPLCPERDWHDSVDNALCGGGGESLYKNGSTLTNHQTTEYWALFPELAEGTTAVNLTLPNGLPSFTQLPVARA